MPYGTLSMADLKATTTQSVVQMGPGYEEAIYQVFKNSLAAHNRVTDNLVSTFVERTTDRLVGVGGIQTVKMDDLDEFGTGHAQKVAPGENMGFPLRLAGLTLQWTLTYFQRATPAALANQLTAAADADKLRVIRDIKRGLYYSTNTSFVDVRMADQATLAVKALANADSMSVPVGPNGETFNAATHNHYAGTSSFVAGDLTTLITNVAEHYEANDIVLAINPAEEATIRAFTGFVATVDARIVQPQTATYVQAPRSTCSSTTTAKSASSAGRPWSSGPGPSPASWSRTTGSPPRCSRCASIRRARATSSCRSRTRSTRCGPRASSGSSASPRATAGARRSSIRRIPRIPNPLLRDSGRIRRGVNPITGGAPPRPRVSPHDTEAPPVAETKKDDEKKVAVVPADVAKALSPQRSPKSNETVPGGRFIVNGVAVDCNGNPLKDKATAEELRGNTPADEGETHE